MSLSQGNQRARPITIAHRGACAYLPEHSLAAKAYAHAQGAEFIEQDVVATADDALVVLHDIHLESVTDVASAFTDRARDDGRYYARDFTLNELKQLRLRERSQPDGTPVFDNRYPSGLTPFEIPTLAEELQLIRGLNHSTGRHAGIYPEIKKPAWHREEGVDIAPLLLDVLKQAGYDDTPEQVWLQCFDSSELIRLKSRWRSPYRQVQLIGDDSWNESPDHFAAMIEPEGLVFLKGIADGIGPWIPQLYTVDERGNILGTALIEHAHALNMQVHPYTLRADALPPGFETLESLLTWLTEQGIDGIFSDFPDRAVRLFDGLGLASQAR
ncbi:MAG: glycerophosphodiester phosphodiesterase [Pseudomonadota bacterium]